MQHWTCPQCKRIAVLPEHAFKVNCPCGYIGQFKESPPPVFQNTFKKKRGLGDWLAAILDPLGGRLYKRLYKKLFGRPCPCEERQEKLNSFGSHAAELVYWCARALVSVKNLF